MALYTLQEAKRQVKELRAKGTNFESALQFLADQGYPSELLDQLKDSDFKQVTQFRQTKPKDEHPGIWVLVGIVVIVIAGLVILQVMHNEKKAREALVTTVLEENGFSSGSVINISTNEGILHVQRTNNTANVTGTISIEYFTIKNAFLDPNTRPLNKAVKLCRAMGELFDNQNRGRGTIALKKYQTDENYIKQTKWAILALAINDRKMDVINVDFTHAGSVVYECDANRYIQDTTLDRIQITNLH